MQKDYSQNMKWYKFIIYVQLFLSALVNLGSGISCLFGLQYGDTATAQGIYAWFPGLKAVDVVMGIFCLAMAAVCIIVRQNLRHFRKNAPYQYLGILVCNIVSQIVYVVAACGVTGFRVAAVLDRSTIMALVAGVFLLCANLKYFKNRMYMFGNSERSVREDGFSGNKGYVPPDNYNQGYPPQGSSEQGYGQVYYTPPQSTDGQEYSPQEVYGQTMLPQNGDADQTALLSSGGEMTQGVYQQACRLIRQKTGEQITLNRFPYYLGKSRDMTDYVVSDNPAISRQHAYLSMEGTQYTITDLDSTNHTYVNGQCLLSNMGYMIHDGDRIRLADEEFVFYAG